MAYKYERVAADLRHRLAWHEWSIGERLPGVHELAAHYQVSPSVIGDAQEALRMEGLIETRRGSGTFVVSVPESGDMTLGLARRIDAVRAELATAREALARAEGALERLTEQA